MSISNYVGIIDPHRRELPIFSVIDYANAFFFAVAHHIRQVRKLPIFPGKLFVQGSKVLLNLNVGHILEEKRIFILNNWSRHEDVIVVTTTQKTSNFITSNQICS